MEQCIRLDRFACVDGSTVIPWSRINDDYCDCEDGSDEPGLSLLAACCLVRCAEVREGMDRVSWV